MLNYYCDGTGTARKCTAQHLYQCFRHPNHFPSDKKPYGLFNQISFSVHPELTLAVYLAAQNQNLPRGKANIRMGLSKRSCWFCEHYLSAFKELLEIEVAVNAGYSGKKVAGWRLPPALDGILGMDEFLSMVDMKVFRKTSLKVRAIIAYVCGDTERGTKVDEIKKMKRVDRSPSKGPMKVVEVKLEDANDALVKWLEDQHLNN
ncbi:hypothetical protein ABW21_db0201152 [Orbilia brochopaga]|nr:hypothetical protein ABW21_db0201152 [Drechslerella brochopaga]